ncbi:hypothetical protein [Sediminihabitans luteus]|uniref:hypothetical protein n=1 Tax=Sediminihabitans luteus TaxID=1138585 RepID=UPI0012FD0333|nr:hypothetical protein [Sediminihabitans luteus]
MFTAASVVLWSQPATAYTPDCGSTWSPTVAYRGGDVVTIPNTRLAWRARSWTYGDTPGRYAAEWYVWEPLGTCGPQFPPDGPSWYPSDPVWSPPATPSAALPGHAPSDSPIPTTTGADR